MRRSLADQTPSPTTTNVLKHNLGTLNMANDPIFPSPFDHTMTQSPLSTSLSQFPRSPRDTCFSHMFLRTEVLPIEETTRSLSPPFHVDILSTTHNLLPFSTIGFGRTTIWTVATKYSLCPPHLANHLPPCQPQP
ncbi:hypothetical protein VNO78_06361 [Psophocarpus tetragonolobus]|uniref:Uncharacterized protein n=1 Tax=Psophocarpus tetragonolobus TaxID=3891 RepID=A0AAN9T1X1_PSOTE